MKRTVSQFLFFTMILMGFSSTPAEAQFWKKLFKKEEKKKPEKVAPKKPAVTPSVAAPVKKRVVEYPPTEKKSRYRVDVLVSLYLDELVQNGKATFKSKMPEKAAAGLEFYEGIKLAADTLNKLGFDIDVHIHDVTGVNTTPEMLVKNNALDASDLIIGALQSQQVEVIAADAKKNKVNFISALSPSDADVTNNPYFTLLQPSLRSHCAAIMSTIQRKYKGVKPLILHRDATSVDKAAYSYISESAVGAKSVLVNTTPNKADIAPLLTKEATNVIIISIMDGNYAEELLVQLYKWFPDYKIEVFGMPSWDNLASLRKPNDYPGIAVTITTPFNYSETSSAGKYVVENYKSDLGGKPGDLVFRGYETMFWYAYLLQRYGTIFNEKMNDNGIAPFTKFQIKTQWDKDDNLLYNENKHVNLYRYQNGSFMIQ